METITPDLTSSFGRAVQTRTQGMTPDQVEELDRQYAKWGLKSLNYVKSLKEQIDDIRNTAQGSQPPQTTVVQDLEQQLNNAKGISTLPSNVGNADSYAKGGIVAFSTGDVVGPYTDEQLRLAGQEAARQANAAAERGVVQIAGKGAARKGIGSLLGKIPRGGNLWTVAAAIGIPALISLLGGDDEEEAPAKSAPQTESPASQPTAPSKDLTALMQEAQQRSGAGGIALKGQGTGMPDVSGAYSGLLSLARKEAESNKPEDRAAIEAKMEKRTEGLTDHISEREKAIDEQEASSDREFKKAFWDSMSTGFLKGAIAAGEDGATGWGSAAEGALAGLEKYQSIADKHEQEKAKLADLRFTLGEAKATHKRGVITMTDTEENRQRDLYQQQNDKVLALEAQRVNAILTAQNEMLNRQTQLAIASYRDRGLTGLDLLANTAAFLAAKGATDSQDFKHIINAMAEISGASPQVIATQYRTDAIANSNAPIGTLDPNSYSLVSKQPVPAQG